MGLVRIPAHRTFRKLDDIDRCAGVTFVRNRNLHQALHSGNDSLGPKTGTVENYLYSLTHSNENSLRPTRSNQREVVITHDDRSIWTIFWNQCSGNEFGLVFELRENHIDGCTLLEYLITVGMLDLYSFEHFSKWLSD